MLPSLKLRSCDMTTPWKINGWNIIIGVWFWSFSLQKWVICMFQSVIFQIVSFTPKTSPRLPTRTAPELVHAKEAGEAEAKDHENTQETRQAHLQNKGRQAGKPGNSVVGEGLVNQLVYIYICLCLQMNPPRYQQKYMIPRSVIPADSQNVSPEVGIHPSRSVEWCCGWTTTNRDQCLVWCEVCNHFWPNRFNSSRCFRYLNDSESTSGEPWKQWLSCRTSWS